MVNLPIPADLPSESRKAARILQAFIDPNAASGIDQVIPPSILANCKGLAILTVIKAGFVWSGRAGSGLVVARLADGTWSAPSCIGTASVGFGGQIGAEMTDFVIVLNSTAAVKAFSLGGNVTLGGNLSVAAGPLGRNAEGNVALGHVAPIYSYSKTRGLFAGISIEGTVILERKDANAKFYGRKVSAKELLSGTIPPPREADALYRALNLRVTRTAAAAGRTEYNTTPSSGHQSSPSAFNDDYVSHIPAADTEAPHLRPSGAPEHPPLHMPHSDDYRSPGRSNSVTRGPPPPVPSRSKGTYAVAMFDFDGEQAGDLSFRKGDLVRVTKQTDNQNDWWDGECNGHNGSFPANYVKLN
ncbi:hypothetical protein IWQ60_006827 [Tieghemiomyces parasiticus]|uniref:SH3 domain-containing protein n=1 Tax=Tieghemiomyces parasiticus TaxID=78921 RepID=A0A9W8A856_9FUNG|nr:hypothetical protein IWQ60_006827 [Tieghemiomyces parasiticus]